MSPPHIPAHMPTSWARLKLAVVTATGADAVRFVDNFATAAISSLSIGAGTEAFFADSRGWVLALATVLRTDAGLVILAAPGLGPSLRDHLERYHIREAAKLTDASASLAMLLVTGREAGAVVQRLLASETLPSSGLAHLPASADAAAVRVVRVEGQGADGFWLLAAPDAIAALGERLTASGVPEADPATLDAMRIEACYPAPADIIEKTLPQELGRDARGISFTKGCYLGQETVARLDALGHVNRRLALVAIAAAEQPAPPALLELDGQTVATLTSVCHSPSLGCPIGLGLIPTRALASDRLRVGTAPARIVTVAGTSQPCLSTPEAGDPT